MKTVLLTGGTGFVGRRLRSALQDRAIVLLGRGKPELHDNERWTRLDLAEPVASEKLAGGDVLCHLAFSMADPGANVGYNRHLLDAVNASPNIEQVVLVSSVAVYGANTLPVVDENSPCEPVGEYAASKLACETLWLEGLREDCRLTVVRPATIVGHDGEGLDALIRDALHRPVMGAFKRSVLYHHSVHYVAMSNVVSALRFCLYRSQDSAREIYVVSDDHYPENESYAAMQDAVREIHGRDPLPSVTMPRRVLRLLGAIASRRLGITGPPLGLKQIYSSRKIHAAGFEDAISLREEVRRMVDSLEKR